MMDMGFSVVIIIIIVIINNINIALLIPFGKMSLESVFQNVWERLHSSLD